MLGLETTSSTTTSSSSPITTTSMASQYIQPDYLSPLSSTLDAKRSPLALLAQTCSQIGADPTPPPPPPTSSSAATALSSSSSTSSASLVVKSSGDGSGSKKGSSKDHVESKSSSKTPPAKQHNPYDFGPSSGRREEPSGNIKGDHHEPQHHGKGFKSPGVSGSKSGGSPPSTTSSSAATAAAGLPPTTLPGADALPLRPFDPSSLGAYRPPLFPGLYNPYDALGAFRHPAYSAHLAAAYPPVSSLGLSLASYQQALQSSYGRLAAASTGKPGELSSLSVCRDPYCTGCPASGVPAAPTSTASSTSSPTAAASSCPAGCNQCDHQKTTISSASATSSSPSTLTTTTTSAASPAAISSRPYVCNWIAADNYCGKRFTSSEELLQHLRTHTSLAVPSVETPSTVSAYSGSPSAAALSHSHLLAASAAASLHHRSAAYPTPPLSPLSMARYHPYSKAPTSSPLSSVPTGAGAPPPPPNPLALSLAAHHQQHNPYLVQHPGLAAAYYSHPAYSLYSQRMLAGAGVLP